MKIRVINIFTGLLVLFSPLSYAEIDISGYASFKAISNSNKDDVAYYNGLAAGDHINFDSRESNLGLQFSTEINSKMDMTVVMSARGGAQKYNFETEWAYLNYKMNDDLSLRIGKVKGPFYMVSDYKDVGYAYPWVTPPEEVYSTNPIRSVNGIDFVYQKSVNDVSYLGEIYYGSGTNTAFVPTKGLLGDAFAGFGMPAASAAQFLNAELSFETYNMLGFNASVSYEGISFRAGYFNTKVAVGGLTDLDGSFGGVGMTIDKNNFVVYAEYIVRDTGPELIAMFPDQEAAYITAGYRMGDYLPYVTVATIDEGTDASPYALKQDSTAIGLRMEVADSASLKFEAAQKKVAAGDFGLYDGPMTDNGNIYSVALDVLF